MTVISEKLLALGPVFVKCLHLKIRALWYKGLCLLVHLVISTASTVPISQKVLSIYVHKELIYKCS